MNVRTDLLLLQALLPRAADAAAWARDCAAFAAGFQMAVQRAAWSPQAGLAFAYLVPPAPGTTSDERVAELTAAAARQNPQATGVRVSRLEKVFESEGASPGAQPAFHYVVETDPEPDWQAEIVRWYDVEHMPGLAAVPGCIRAARFVNHDGGPASLACYDLEREETLGAPAWLAVRHTAWSSQVRPHFTNTRRTMFRVST